MLCGKCGYEHDGEKCPLCEDTFAIKIIDIDLKPEEPEFYNAPEEPSTEQEAVLEDAPSEDAPSEDAPSENAPEEDSPEEDSPKKKICKKCGYTYTEQNCPVCVARAIRARRAANSQKKRSKLGMAGMITSFASLYLNLFVSNVFLAFPVALVSLIISIAAQIKNKKDGFATAGICVSLGSILLSVIEIILVVLVLICYLIIIIVLISQGGIPTSDVDSVF